MDVKARSVRRLRLQKLLGSRASEALGGTEWGKRSRQPV